MQRIAFLGFILSRSFPVFAGSQASWNLGLKAGHLFGMVMGDGLEFAYETESWILGASTMQGAFESLKVQTRSDGIWRQSITNVGHETLLEVKWKWNKLWVLFGSFGYRDVGAQYAAKNPYGDFYTSTVRNQSQIGILGLGARWVWPRFYASCDLIARSQPITSKTMSEARTNIPELSPEVSELNSQALNDGHRWGSSATERYLVLSLGMRL